jgi:hypothetical protein
MVLHPEACWGGLPTRVQKTKIYNLETDEFASTPPFSKKAFGGSISQVTFGGKISKTIWRELFKKHLAGTFKNIIWQEQFQKHIWQEHLGRNILAGNLIFF